MASTAVGAGSGSARGGNADYSQPPQSSYANPVKPQFGGPPVVAGNPHAGHYALGLLLGLIVGTTAAVIIEKVLVFGGFGLSFFYILMGYGIGWGIWKFTGRGGPGLALAAVGVMAVALFISHIVLTIDIIHLAAAKDGTPERPFSFGLMAEVCDALGIMHWICILIGMGGCYRAMEQQPA